MKILFFIRSLVVGGSQRQLVMLAEGLARRGHDAAIAVFYTGGEIEHARRAAATRVLPLHKRGRWDAIGPLGRLRRLMRTERPDVVYAFQPTQTALAATVLPRRLPARLVFGVRAAGMELGRSDALSSLSHRLEPLLARRADLVIANAYAGRADCLKRGFPADRLAVVPNGIDTEAMQPDPAAGRALRRMWQVADDAFVIGCVARLDPMKDHPTFLRAAAEYARDHADARFVCVGSGSAAYREELAGLATSLGLDRRLVWAGEMSDVRAAYGSFDVATLASSFGEGFSNVIGEAMACAAPVVATDVGDARRIIGELGEVVPVSQPKLLCAGWTRLRERLIRNPGLRQAARDSIVANFAVDRMIGRTEQILLRLVAGCSAAELADQIA